MKRLMFFLAFVLVSSLSFAQTPTIQYKNELTDDWQNLDVSKIEPKCLSKAKILKLSGDFSNFKVKLKKSNGQSEEYETGLVINSCLNGYPDKILTEYHDSHLVITDTWNHNLREVDMSDVTGTNSLKCFLMGCDFLKKIDFPKSTIKNKVDLEAAFFECQSLKEIDLSMFTNIQNLVQSFLICKELTKVTFNSNKMELGGVGMYRAFNGCRKLKSVDLSMFSIEKNVVNGFYSVFKDCYSLNYVYLPNDFVVTDHENTRFPEPDFLKANPNCIKILSTDDKEQVPARVDEWTNVVYKGGKAYTNFVLEEGKFNIGNNFYYTYESPMDIDLGDKRATFTPIVNTYGNGVGGWNTITLPFTGALQVKGDADDDYKTVYPATSSFQGFYWLRGYKGGTGKAVSFGVVNDVDKTTGEALQANTPYIIALPGSNFGDDSMEGKQVRFIATSAKLPMTKATDIRVNGENGNYAFQGNLNADQVVGTAYKLVNQNNGRDYFEETTNANVPFHAQIISTAGTISNAKRLSISYGETTGIVGVKNETSQQPSTYFTIGGVNTGITDAKLLKKGIYIHGNKKIIIK